MVYVNLHLVMFYKTLEILYQIHLHVVLLNIIEVLDYDPVMSNIRGKLKI